MLTNRYPPPQKKKIPPSFFTTINSDLLAGTTTLSQVLHTSNAAVGGYEAIHVAGFSDLELEEHIRSEALEPMDIKRHVFHTRKRAICTLTTVANGHNVG